MLAIPQNGFCECNYSVPGWSACSPELNPIEGSPIEEPLLGFVDEDRL